MDGVITKRAGRLSFGGQPAETVRDTNHQRTGIGRVGSNSGEWPADLNDARRADGRRLSETWNSRRARCILAGAMSAGGKSPLPTHRMKLDVNCDLGEGEPLGHTRALMRWITSANVACGGHAGDVTTMQECVRLARATAVRLGAHPGPWNRPNLGRDRL